MITPHSSIQVNQELENDQNYLAKLEKSSLYLVRKSDAQLSNEKERIKFLEEKVRSLHQEVYDLTSLLEKKEQLLQNFRIREQELKTWLFQTMGENKRKMLSMPITNSTL